MPRDIDENVSELESVYHYTVDDLQDIIQRNLSQREQASEQAQDIITQECTDFFEWLKVHQFSNLIRHYRDEAENTRQELLEKALHQIQQGENAEKILQELSYKLMNKLIHAPIFGYTILNDVSARDVQTAHKQWYFGKSLDGFTPIGPCIVTADAFADYPPRLGIRSFVNGEKRQNSNTALQIFDIDHVVAELSQGMTLKAGTIIATGTPAGVGMGMDPPQFLKPGDVVRCEIEGIGTLTNPVK